MDYFNGNGTEENLSLQDMIECDIRSNFNEHLGNGEILGSHSNMESQLSVTVGGIGSMLDYDINSLDMTDTKSGLAGFVSSSDLNWLQTVNLSSLQELCRPENTDPNLMVNPQTGMPISQEQSMSTDSNAMLSETSQNLNESAVREALLRTPDHTTLIAVPPSQVQQQPQYIQQQPHQQSQQNSESENRPQQHQQQSQQNSQTQTIRQHLQAQVQQPPHSPTVSMSYPAVSSPQPMVVSSPQKCHSKVIMNDVDKIYPKPVYSYSCLIAMALKNSDTGCLPVSEIYNFMTENFPYFKTAPDGWKNSVRHNLSLNKCFEKIENPKSTGTTKKGCLWAMNPAKIEKMEEEIAKWRKKDPIAIKRSMAKPEVLDLLEQGQGGRSPRSPHHTISAAPVPTSINNNNNITKLNSPAITTASTPERPQLSKVVTNISANVNVIEIKPVVKPIKTESIGAAPAVKEELTNLSTDELSVLDNNLTLDPALSDLAIQNGLFGAVSHISSMFDDINSDDLNMDDLPSGESPLSFTFSSSGGLTASPIHFNAGASGAGNFIVTPTIDEKAAIQSSFNLYNCSAATPTSTPSTPTSKYAISRTVSAQT